MTKTKQTSTTKVDRRPNCVTETHMSSSILTASSFFRRGATDAATNETMKVLEAEATT